MRIRAVLGGALMLTAVGAGMAGVPGAAQAAPVVTHRPARVTMNECYTTRPLSAPRTFLVACGDGNAWLRQLTWRNWGRGSATATGRGYFNDCVPYCAAGHFHSYPMRVSVGRLAGSGPKRSYTRLTYRFTGARPVGVQRTTVVTLPR